MGFTVRNPTLRCGAACLAVVALLGCPLQHPVAAGAFDERPFPSDGPPERTMDVANDPATIELPDGTLPDTAMEPSMDASTQALSDMAHDIDATDHVASTDPTDASSELPGEDLALPFDGGEDRSIDLPSESAVDTSPDAVHDTSPTDVGCPPPRLECGGLCVDTLTDPAHCGRCDRACAGRCWTGECFDASDMATGSAHTCAVLRGGGIRCWGDNRAGQLGNASTTSQNRPVAVHGDGYASVGLGNQHSCAVRTDGTVHCWGDNSAGQLGNNTRLASNTPIPVTGLSTAVQVVGGNNFTCARLLDTTARCWGDNQRGQLGNGSMTDSSLPVIPVGLTGVVDIAVGNEHVCAALAEGSVRCWGRNDRGQLARSTATEVLSRPADVSGVSDVQQIEAGSKFTCALTRGGEVRCWGENNHRQLGNDSTSPSSTPVTVMGLTGHTVVQLGCGGNQCCAVLSNGSVRCWGDNATGQLGDGTTTDRGVPVVVRGIDDAVQVSTRSTGHTCARSRTGTIRCWGANMSGQLGDGSQTNRLTPTPIVP